MGARRTSRETQLHLAEIAAELRPRDGVGRMIGATQRLYDRTARHFAVEVAEAVTECFDEVLLAGEPSARAQIEAWVGEQPPEAAPVALWVRARLLQSLGERAAAAKAWNACIDALPRTEPEALLQRARCRVATQDAESAARDLRLALQQPTDYTFWQRATPLLRSLLQDGTPFGRRRLKVALLSGKASTALWAPMLHLACFRDEIDATFYVSDYDAWAREILDPGSGLYAFAPDIVILATHWRDADLPALAADADAAAAAVVSRQVDLWKTLQSRHPCTIVAHGFDRPFHDPYGHLSTTLEGGRRALLQRIDRELRREAGRDVVLLDLDAVAGRCGAAAWEDARQWHFSKQHPGSGGLLELVEAQVAILRALTGLSKKVLVLDLDNVLWGGIIGEDGLEKIQLGPPSPVGEAHQELQRHVKCLQERGVLLAVCSKNNEADAKRPFESHPESILRLDDFVAFVANWEDKATNLRRIAETLSLGTESFVFLDDNPVERQWVRSQIPDLTIPELPADPCLYVETLARGRFFESLAISADDRVRHEEYRRNVQRQALQTAARSYDDFLQQLGMVAQSGPFDAMNLQRIAQLVNKTNQFNLTTRRYTEAQLQEQARDPGWWTQWFRLRDRYGDTGLIGILTCKPRPDEPESREIDNWLLSCRVLGRRMEVFMLRTVLAACRAANVRKLHASYVPTPKNGQVADLLPRLGFERLSAAGETVHYVLHVERAELPEVPIAASDRTDTLPESARPPAPAPET